MLPSTTTWEPPEEPNHCWSVWGSVCTDLLCGLLHHLCIGVLAVGREGSATTYHQPLTW